MFLRSVSGTPPCSDNFPPLSNAFVQTLLKRFTKKSSSVVKLYGLAGVDRQFELDNKRARPFLAFSLCHRMS